MDMRPANGRYSRHVMASLGWDEVELPNPDFERDTVSSFSEVPEAREPRSRPTAGKRVRAPRTPEPPLPGGPAS